MTIDAHVHTYPSREIGRQAMQGTGRTDYGGTPEELLAIMAAADRKSTRLNSSHLVMSYAVFCLKKKNDVSGKMAVGAIPTIAPYVLPELVVTFHRHYPEVTLEIVGDVTERISTRVEAGELDVAS